MQNKPALAYVMAQPGAWCRPHAITELFDNHDQYPIIISPWITYA